MVVDGMRRERERERGRKKTEVNITTRPRIFANFGDISALVRPTSAIKRENRDKREEIRAISCRRSFFFLLLGRRRRECI